MEKNKKKISVVYDLIIFYREKFGGISRMWDEILFKISSKIDIIFIANDSENIANLRLIKKNFYNKFTIKLIPKEFEKKFWIFSFYRSFVLYFMLKKRINKEKFIFHSTDYINPILKVKGCKIVTTIHDMVFWDQSKKFKKNIDFYDRKLSIRNSLKKSDVVITVSETSKKSIIKYFPRYGEKIRVIYHGLNSSFLKTDYVRNKKKNFVFIGGRNSYKNFDFLLETFSEFISVNKDWTLEVFGENSTSKNHEAIKYKKLKIDKNIIDYGLVQNDTLIQKMMSAGAIIIPSLNEGFNFPLLEGLALGTPILSSNIPVSMELGKNYVQYFSPYKKSELLFKMNYLANNGYNEEDLLEGMKYARQFTWEASCKKLLSVYESTL